MVVALLKLSFRLIVLHSGESYFRNIMEEFWLSMPPEQFASDEVYNFASYIAATHPDIPHLCELITYELALHQTLLDGNTRKVHFSCDPMPLLTSLGEGELPRITTKGNFEVAITP
jgi:hypothetical protein